MPSDGPEAAAAKGRPAPPKASRGDAGPHPPQGGWGRAVRPLTSATPKPIVSTRESPSKSLSNTLKHLFTYE